MLKWNATSIIGIMVLTSDDLVDKKFAREIEHFLETTSQEYWDEQLQKTDALGGTFDKVSLQTRNSFIERIKQYLHLRESGKSVLKHRSSEIDYLAGTCSWTEKSLIHSEEFCPKNVRSAESRQLPEELKEG